MTPAIRRLLPVCALLALLFSAITGWAQPNNIHFLIPGGKGGGWDTTARETGKALMETGLIRQASYQNFSGAGGGRALRDMVVNATGYGNTLMVQSSPIILRNISGSVAYGFRDVTPVAIMIAEYQVVAVPKQSPFENLQQLIEAVRLDITRNRIIGGSAKGSLDHITAALILNAAGVDVTAMRYLESDAGGDALRRLYQGDGVALVTGYGEVISELEAGNLRLLAITSETPQPGINTKTAREQGYDVVFANWRGFFAPPTVTPHTRDSYQQLLKRLHDSEHWQAIRQRFGWAPFFKSGNDLTAFLLAQEAEIWLTLQQLGFKTRQ